MALFSKDEEASVVVKEITDQDLQYLAAATILGLGNSQGLDKDINAAIFKAKRLFETMYSKE